MTVISSYKATPQKNGQASWVKEKAEPHLPRGWTKYVCMKNGRKMPWLVQYKDSDGKKYKSLKAVEDFLSQIILRNNWQNVAPWNDFLKNMITAASDKSQKESFKLPKPVGRPKKVQPYPSEVNTVGRHFPYKNSSTSISEPSSEQSLLPGPSVTPLYTPTRSLTPPGPPGPHCLKSPPPPPGPPGPPPPGPPSNSELQSPSKDNPCTLPLVPPSTSEGQSSPKLDPSTSSEDLMVTSHFRAKKPPGPPSPESDVQTPLPADLIKLEPEDYNEEPSEESSFHTPLPSAIPIPMQVGNLKITPVNNFPDTSGESYDVTAGKTKEVNDTTVKEQNNFDDSKTLHMEPSPPEKAQEEEKVNLESRIESSPILSVEQQNKNRKKLTFIENVLDEHQDEIELSFSLASSVQCNDSNESKEDDINEETQKLPNLVIKEKSDSSNNVLKEKVVNNSDIQKDALPLENKIVKTRSESPLNNAGEQEEPTTLSDNKMVKTKNESPNNNAGEQEVPMTLVRKPRTDKRLKWFDGTFYTCNFACGSSDFCGRNFVGRKPFRFHLAQHHGLALKPNDLNGLNGFASKYKEGTYKCRLCSKPVKHDEFGISLHLIKIHKLSIESYTEQFEQGPENLESDKKLNLPSESPSDGHRRNKREAITSLELQLKGNHEQIEYLNTSKNAEREKLEESVKQTKIIKAQTLERIAIIEKEKEALLLRAKEYDEVIEENSNKILKIESVNKNRIAILQEKSEDLTEKIEKAKSELEALPIANRSKGRNKNEVSNSKEKSELEKIDNAAVKIHREEAEKTEDNASDRKDLFGKEINPNFELEIKEDKSASDKNSTLENRIVTSNKNSPRKKRGESLGINKTQPIDKSKACIEEKERRGSALEKKIGSLKAKSEKDRRKKNLVNIPATESKVGKDVSERVGTDVIISINEMKDLEKEVHRDNAALKSKEGAKLEFDGNILSNGSSKEDNKPSRNATNTSRLEVAPPQKRGRKKLSEEEKASRKAMRIENRKLPIEAAGTKVDVKDGFSFSPLEHKKTEGDGVKCKDVSKSFRNLPDSLQKSKKKMQENAADSDSQKAVRDLSKEFANAECRRSPGLKPVLTGTSTSSLSRGSQIRFPPKTDALGQTIEKSFSKKSIVSSSPNQSQRRSRSLRMSLGNVQGAPRIQNLGKSGRGLL